MSQFTGGKKSYSDFVKKNLEVRGVSKLKELPKEGKRELFKSVEKSWSADNEDPKQNKNKDAYYKEAMELRNFVMENIEPPEGILGAAGSIIAAPAHAVGAVGNAVGRTVAAPFKATGAAVKTVGGAASNLLHGDIKGAGQAAVGGVKDTVGAAVKPVTGVASDAVKLVQRPVDALAQ